MKKKYSKWINEWTHTNYKWLLDFCSLRPCCYWFANLSKTNHFEMFMADKILCIFCKRGRNSSKPGDNIVGREILHVARALSSHEIMSELHVLLQGLSWPERGREQWLWYLSSIFVSQASRGRWWLGRTSLVRKSVKFEWACLGILLTFIPG